MNGKEKIFFELKINREFGDIISLYFDFLKTNLRKFTNIFLSYNGIFLIGLLIVSYLKRKQRIIPVIRPLENSSIDFARTVGGLYYEYKDYYDLITKKIELLSRIFKESFLYKYPRNK